MTQTFKSSLPVKQIKFYRVSNCLKGVHLTNIFPLLFKFEIFTGIILEKSILFLFQNFKTNTNTHYNINIPVIVRNCL